MPVTFSISSYPANRFSNPDNRGPPSNDPRLILASLPTTHTPARLLQSSVDGTQDILVRKNGFVLGAVLAYNEHHNLVIRSGHFHREVVCDVHGLLFPLSFSAQMTCGSQFYPS